MFRRLFEWTISLINISKELGRHREAIRELSTRTRDLEEAFKLLSQEVRHSGGLNAAEREKLLLKIESVASKVQHPSATKRRKKPK